MPFDQNPTPVDPKIEADPVLQALVKGHQMIQHCYIPFRDTDGKGGFCSAGLINHMTGQWSVGIGLEVTKALAAQAEPPKTMYPPPLDWRNHELTQAYAATVGPIAHVVAHNNLNGKEATIEMWRKAAEKRRMELMQRVTA